MTHKPEEWWACNGVNIEKVTQKSPIAVLRIKMCPILIFIKEINENMKYEYPKTLISFHIKTKLFQYTEHRESF